MTMKCEKCGKNEANFYYSSNINGNVTEKHLCTECAAEMGLTQDVYAYANNMFEDMMGGFFNRRSAFAPFGSFGGFGGFALPAMMFPRFEFRIGDGAAPAETEQKVETPADPEMKKRRELNMLREQMKKAAENEDYEKAAELKNKISEMEKAE